MGRAEDIFEKITKDNEAAIDDFIVTRQSEELFLDFKRSADNGSSSRLHQNDRENLAKAISGFGNSEGGVIVWGIDCSRGKDHADVAHTKFLIQDVKRFVSWLEGVISGCTVPPLVGVQHHAVITNDKGDGFVITYIPKSVYAPHQVVGRLQYFIRAGSSFVPTPHAVLAGMFGRRPQPHVFHQFTIASAKIVDDRIEIGIGFMMTNRGPGIARDLFMNAMIISGPGDNCPIAFKPSNSNDWVGQFSFGVQISVISKPEVRLPPEAFAQPFVMTLSLAPPFSEGLVIDGICGCDQAPAYKFKIEKSRDAIEQLYKNFMDKHKGKMLPAKEGHKLVQELLDITDQ